MEKPAKTDYPILEPLARRWSPRSFADRPIEPIKIKRMLEAARWAASSFNEQPWRLLVATRDQPEEFAKLLSCLVEANQAWARLAPLLIITCAKKTFSKNGKPNRVHQHDIGLMAANLTIQAMAMDLFSHQMAGILPDRVRELYEVPEDFNPETAIAIGYAGDPGQLDIDWQKQSELSPRERKPLSEIVFTGKFGNPSPLIT